MANFSIDDVMTVEGDDYATPLEVAVALQRAINGGMWSLQGSYGRSMMAAIEAGDAMLGPHDARDYYGNHIPSRTQVEAGTKGSREFVLAAHGQEWLDAIEAA